MAASSRVPLEVAVAGDASRFGDAAAHAAFIFAFGTPVLSSYPKTLFGGSTRR